MDRTLREVRLKWKFCLFLYSVTLSVKHSSLLVNKVARFKIHSAYFPFHANFKILHNFGFDSLKTYPILSTFSILVVYLGNSCIIKECNITNFGNSNFVIYILSTIKAMWVMVINKIWKLLGNSISRYQIGKSQWHLLIRDVNSYLNAVSFLAIREAYSRFELLLELKFSISLR